VSNDLKRGAEELWVSDGFDDDVELALHRLALKISRFRTPYKINRAANAGRFDMVFNLFDELSDPKSSSVCDITLHQGDVLSVLMITKVDLQQAASD
jgi:hypothetical protein